MGYTHGNKWTDELITKEILNVKNVLNLDRMPSRSEIVLAVGNGLSIIIGRRGGYKYWAEKLNLDIKDSETKLGKEYETKIAELLKNKGYEVERMSMKHPYDLLVNQNIKVDVKISNLYRGPKGNFHTFNLEKYNHNCDLFICVCVTDEEIVKTLVIPSKFLMKVSQLSVGGTSIYDKYIDRFDFIKEYDAFYKNLAI